MAPNVQSSSPWPPPPPMPNQAPAPAPPRQPLLPLRRPHRRVRSRDESTRSPYGRIKPRRPMHRRYRRLLPRRWLRLRRMPSLRRASRHRIRLSRARLRAHRRPMRRYRSYRVAKVVRHQPHGHRRPPGRYRLPVPVRLLKSQRSAAVTMRCRSRLSVVKPRLKPHSASYGLNFPHSLADASRSSGAPISALRGRTIVRWLGRLPQPSKPLKCAAG